MDIMDLASKGIAAITKNFGKKVAKQKQAPEIPEVQPTVIKGGAYSLGFATHEIMPDLKDGKTYWIAGHGSGHKMEGVLTPVYASAVWLDCSDGEGILWLGADIIGLTGVEVHKIRDMLADFSKETNCKCINISCTHSHSGIDTVGYWGKPNLVSIPSDGKDPEYMDMLMNTMVQVAKEAYANKKQGKLYLGTKQVKDSQFDRRPPKKMNDTLTRFRFAPDDGSTETWIMNFAAHPNSLGGSNRLLSGEYPYFMREDIKNACGANVLYGIGAIGAVDMAEYDKDDKVENIKKQGAVLAEAALSIDNDTELEPEITVVQQPFYFPVGNYVLTLLAMRGTMNTDIYPNDAYDTGLALKSEMTYMKFGSKQMLLLPGEMFPSTVYGGYDEAVESSTGLDPKVNPPALADVADDPDLLVFGVTNDMTGYVVPPNDFVLNKTQPYLNTARDRFDNRHYHETNSLGDKSQLVIEQEFAKIMSRVK